MSPPLLYTITAAILVGIGLYGTVSAAHPIRKLLALNLTGSGVFLLYLALGGRSGEPDPLPQAMVLTGIVIAIASTAFGLALFVRLHRLTGSHTLDSEDEAR